MPLMVLEPKWLETLFSSIILPYFVPACGAVPLVLVGNMFCWTTASLSVAPRRALPWLGYKHSRDSLTISQLLTTVFNICQYNAFFLCSVQFYFVCYVLYIWCCFHFYIFFIRYVVFSFLTSEFKYLIVSKIVAILIFVYSVWLNNFSVQKLPKSAPIWRRWSLLLSGVAGTHLKCCKWSCWCVFLSGLNFLVADLNFFCKIFFCWNVEKVRLGKVVCELKWKIFISDYVVLIGMISLFWDD